jgi:hypothetical protein
MGMLSESELKEALAAAAHMRETGQDPHQVARALLNLNYQNRQFHHLLEALEHYMHSGMATLELQRLRLSIDKTKDSISRTGHIEEEKFGLE